MMEEVAEDDVELDIKSNQWFQGWLCVCAICACVVCACVYVLFVLVL